MIRSDGDRQVIMPKQRDNDEERARRVDAMVEQGGKAEALSRTSAQFTERATRAKRQAKAAIEDAERFVPPVRKSSA